MEKMNKKGWIETFIAAVALFAITYLVYIIALNSIHYDASTVTAVKGSFNKDLMLINLLRAKYNDQSIQDIILAEYNDADYQETKEAVAFVLDKAFDANVCWRLNVRGVNIGVQKDCTSLNDLKVDMDEAQAKLPVEDCNDNLININIRFYNE
jgi:hypothetical protein